MKDSSETDSLATEKFNNRDELLNHLEGTFDELGWSQPVVLTQAEWRVNDRDSDVSYNQEWRQAVIESSEKGFDDSYQFTKATNSAEEKYFTIRCWGAGGDSSSIKSFPDFIDIVIQEKPPYPDNIPATLEKDGPYLVTLYPDSNGRVLNGPVADWERVFRTKLLLKALGAHSLRARSGSAREHAQRRIGGHVDFE